MEVMHLTTYKNSWALHCKDFGTYVTIQQVLDHIENGGTIEAEDRMFNNTTDYVLCKLLKYVKLDTDDMYAAIRAGRRVECQTPNLEHVC